MKTLNLVRSGRQMEVTAVEGTIFGQATTKGHIKWVQNNYDQAVTWYILTNANGSRVEIEFHSKMSKSMKAYLVKELTKIFLEGNEQ